MNVHRKIWILMLGLVVGATAKQLEFLSDTITFRESPDTTEVTQHYGCLHLKGSSAGGYYGILSQNQTTNQAGWGTYGVCAYSNTSPNGIGGRFDAWTKGVVGISTLSTTSTDRYGGYFSAGGSTHINYGVYAKTEGGDTVWAGYFAGDVYCTGDYEPSDSRLKLNVTPLTGSLQRLMQLKPQQYYFDRLTYPGMNLPSSKQYGLLTEDVKQVFPEMVRVAGGLDAAAPDTTGGSATGQTAGERFECMNYTALVPVLLQAIQEQQAQIAELQEAVAELRR